MIGTENKMMDSIKYILQNVEISGFKAEFDLGTKQVRLELLAEFDDLNEGLEKLNGLKLSSAKSDGKNNANASESDTQPLNAPENGNSNEKAKTENKSRSQAVPKNENDPENKYCSKISKKIDEFITTGSSPYEKINLKHNDQKKDLRSET